MPGIVILIVIVIVTASGVKIIIKAVKVGEGDEY